MDALVLVFTACLASDPSSCREVEVPTEMTAEVCAKTLAAQTEMIAWLRKHPKYRVAPSGWRCSAPGKET